MSAGNPQKVEYWQFFGISPALEMVVLVQAQEDGDAGSGPPAELNHPSGCKSHRLICSMALCMCVCVLTVKIITKRRLWVNAVVLTRAQGFPLRTCGCGEGQYQRQESLPRWSHSHSPLQQEKLGNWDQSQVDLLQTQHLHWAVNMPSLSMSSTWSMNLTNVSTMSPLSLPLVGDDEYILLAADSLMSDWI